MSTKDSNDNAKCCWIDTISFPAESDPLYEMYQEVGAAHGKIHNLYKAFSLQPKPLIAADRHYRDVLHNEDNKSEPWLLELLASQAAIIADCHYALTNHGANFVVLLGDEDKASKMLDAISADDFDRPDLFTAQQTAILRYGAKLCRTPERMREQDVEALRKVGVSDTEILEAVQATSCFAYWVRFINGLGIQLGTESIGLFDENGNRRKG